MPVPRAFALLAFSLLVVPGHAGAQSTGRSLDIDVSIRSAGMGGASAAVFWGQDLNHWSNPALLGSVTGLRFERGRTKLLPELADEIVIESSAFKLGGGGVGILLSGPAGVDLDYGQSEGTDPSGNYTGPFESWERTQTWGAGLSVARAVENLLRLARGREPTVAPWGDVSLGITRKDLEMRLAPGMGGATTAYDWGLLARATPLHLRGEVLVLQAELGYAHSTLSYNDDATVEFPNEDQAERVARHRVDGFSVRVAASPRWLERELDDGFLAGLMRGFAPLVSVGASWERTTSDAGEGSFSYRRAGTGLELSFANVFAIRAGGYEDRTGGIDDGTSGWSVGLPVGPWGGARFDHARFPQAADSGLDDLEREGWSVWIDPVAIWRITRR